MDRQIIQVQIDRQLDRYKSGCVGFYPANSQGDDIIVYNPDNPGIDRQIDNPGIDRQIVQVQIDRQIIQVQQIDR